jgi:hypothetical protein
MEGVEQALLLALSCPAPVEYRATSDCERCYKDAITADAKSSLPGSDKAHVAAVVNVRNPEVEPQIVGYAPIHSGVLLYLTEVNIVG